MMKKDSLRIIAFLICILFFCGNVYGGSSVVAEWGGE